MKPRVTFDKTIVTVARDEVVNLLVELAAPPAPAAERPPLDVVLVLDKSGSMSGRPLAAVKSATAHLLRLLGTDDRVAVVAFDSHVELVLDLDRHDTDLAIAKVHAIRGGGSTNLSGGWLKAVEILESSVRDTALRRVVLLTDGQANVGIVDPDRLCSHTSSARAKGITTSTIGFGDDFDEKLLSALADAGAGNDYWCAGPDQAPQIFNDEFEGLASVVAQNVSVELRPSSGVIAMHILNDHPITEVNGGVQVALGDAYGDEKRKVVAAFTLPPFRDAGPFPLGEIVLRWTGVGEDIELHTVTIPIGIGVATDPDAPDPDADPAVTEQVNVLRAAEARRAALEAIERNDFRAAGESLDHAADLLSCTSADPALIDELRSDSRRARRGVWSDVDSKKQWSTRRGEAKGRKSRYDD